jgi:ribonuclease HI
MLLSSSVEGAVNVYADGSTLWNDARKGGVGIRLVIINDAGNDEEMDVPIIGFKATTPNQMELHACAVGIREAMAHPAYARLQRIVVHTDSRYVTENRADAVFYWSRHKWHNSRGRAVANANLWEDLVKAMKSAGWKVKFNWVKGHAKDIHNKAADRLARASAKAAVLPPLARVNVRRKTSAEMARPGSVGLYGQRLSILVVTDRWLDKARVFQYKYQVLTRTSPYFDCLDFACSRMPMGAGHSYLVLMNDDMANPTITKVFNEIRKGE